MRAAIGRKCNAAPLAMSADHDQRIVPYSHDDLAVCLCCQPIVSEQVRPDAFDPGNEGMIGVDSLAA